MRAANRIDFPDFALLFKEINQLLIRNKLSQCDKLVPVSDGDTANPNLICYAGSEEYVIKVCYRHADTQSSRLKSQKI